jgi:hypothetical protein
MYSFAAGILHLSPGQVEWEKFRDITLGKASGGKQIAPWTGFMAANGEILASDKMRF